MSTEYPEYVRERVKKIAETFRVDEQQVWEQFKQYLSDPFVKSDPQFRTDDDRYRYVLELLWVLYAAQPPTEQILFISLGYTDVRMTQQGPVSRIYGLAKAKGDKSFKRSVIVCRGPQADLVREVIPLRAYKLKVAKMARADNIFFATSQTHFTEPQPLPMDPLDFVGRELGVPVLKLADVANNMSKRQGKYVDEFDWRALVGIVVRYNFGTRPSGGKWAVYTVSDDSLTGNYISPDGYIVQTSFTVWVPYDMMKYDVDSKLLFRWLGNGERGGQGSIYERLPSLPNSCETLTAPAVR
jgi:hypothetical protein